MMPSKSLQTDQMPSRLVHSQKPRQLALLSLDVRPHSAVRGASCRVIAYSSSALAWPVSRSRLHSAGAGSRQSLTPVESRSGAPDRRCRTCDVTQHGVRRGNGRGGRLCPRGARRRGGPGGCRSRMLPRATCGAGTVGPSPDGSSRPPAGVTGGRPQCIPAALGRADLSSELPTTAGPTVSRAVGHRTRRAAWRWPNVAV